MDDASVAWIGEKYCQQQREILRALEGLKVNERTTYELDNQKD